MQKYVKYSLKLAYSFVLSVVFSFCLSASIPMIFGDNLRDFFDFQDKPYGYVGLFLLTISSILFFVLYEKNNSIFRSFERITILLIYFVILSSFFTASVQY